MTCAFGFKKVVAQPEQKPWRNEFTKIAIQTHELDPPVNVRGGGFQIHFHTTIFS